jgi:hypothetical protein
MSIFGKIMDKIFPRGEAKAETPVAPSPAPAPASGSASAQTDSLVAPPVAQVDVGAVLSEMASMKGGGGNYQTSIVDLLKLLDLDSSLDARKELADEIGVHAADHGTTEQNIALHRAVMAKLAENGGVVPDSLRN